MINQWVVCLGDEIDELIDWDAIEEVESKDRIKSGVPIGTDIQRALRDECLKVSPYVRMESGSATKFDLVMYIPNGMPFIVDSPEYAHCWHKFRRIYCKKKWDQVKLDFRIPHDEQNKRYEELKEKHKDEEYYYPTVPTFRYTIKEYNTESDFWKSNAKKDIAMCDQEDCEWWNGIQQKHKEDREKYGFMDGLHIFEIKSDKDTHTLLSHQIPNMISIADYVWLVLGENQPKPEWLPPYISVLRFKDGEFTIEHKHEIKIIQPPTYKDALRSQGYRIESSEEYAFHRLMRTWIINSMFHYQFEGQIIIDMQEDIEGLLSFMKRADKNKTKQDYARFQRNLFNYVEHGSNEGSGTNGN